MSTRTPETFVPVKLTCVVLAVYRFFRFNASAVVPAFEMATLAMIVPVKVDAPAVSVAIFLVESNAIVFVLAKLTI